MDQASRALNRVISNNTRFFSGLRRQVDFSADYVGKSYTYTPPNWKGLGTPLIMTFSDPRTHAPPLYKSLGILQLKDIIHSEKCLFMYDYSNNRLPRPFTNYFTLSSKMHKYNTRYSSFNFHLPSVSSNSGKFSLKFSGIKTWSSLDSDTKLLPRKLFIKKIKKNCLQSYF